MGKAVITLRDLMPVARPEKTKVKFNMNAGDVSLRAYDLLLKDTSTPERTDSGSRWYEMNAWRSATGQANNNLNHAEYLLSFAQYYTYGPEYFIFGGMHRVEKAVPEVLGGVGYKLTLLPDYEAYIKRLIIKLKKPIGRDIYNKFYENTIHDFEPVTWARPRATARRTRARTWASGSAGAPMPTPWTPQAATRNSRPSWPSMGLDTSSRTSPTPS